MGIIGWLYLGRDLLSNLIEITLIILLILYLYLRFKENNKAQTAIKKRKIIKFGGFLILALIVINLLVALMGVTGTRSYSHKSEGDLFVKAINVENKQDLTMALQFRPKDPVAYWAGFKQDHSPLYQFLYRQYLSLRYSNLVQKIFPTEKLELNLWLDCQTEDSNQFLLQLKENQLIPGNTVSTSVSFCSGFCLQSKNEIHYANLYKYCK